MELPDWLTSTLASDAAAGDGVLEDPPRPLRLDQRVGGPVITASIPSGLTLRSILEAPVEPGCVIVAQCDPDVSHAIAGGIIAGLLLKAGVVAIVTDGRVRDAAEIADSGPMVWCRGLTPRAPTNPGGRPRLGVPVDIGGVRIADGDIVVADEDGIVVWPAGRAEALLAAAYERREQDTARRLRG